MLSILLKCISAWLEMSDQRRTLGEMKVQPQGEPLLGRAGLVGTVFAFKSLVCDRAQARIESHAPTRSPRPLQYAEKTFVAQ